MYKFQDLVEITKKLRAPDGCMWDREQTHKSIRRNFIEEVYEAIEAIDNDDTDLLREELGDVLLQVVFHAEMESEIGSFDIDDVCDGICKKLVFRHPHIFGDTKVEDSKEILKNWDELKKIEKGHKKVSEGMDSVAKSLPALIRSEKIQSKAAKVGFDWDDTREALLKVREEIDEVLEATDGMGNIEEEIGDMLFALVNVSRRLKVDPEHALAKACDKFTDRFSYVEDQITKSGKEFRDLTLAEMDELWEEKKRLEKSSIK